MTNNDELLNELLKRIDKSAQVIEQLLDRVNQLEIKVDELAEELSDLDDRVNLNHTMLLNHENELWSLK